MGEDAEKKELAEEVLTEIWQTALTRLETTANEGKEVEIVNTFPRVAEEVRKILGEVKSEKGTIKDVQKLSVQKACILLHVTCETPYAMLEIIRYLECKAFHDRMATIAKELGYHFNTAFVLDAVMQIDNLCGITKQMSMFK